MTNMWKLITEPKLQVQKICNECGKVIDTFDSTHPLTQYLIFDLQAHIPDKVDLDKLDFGLQPYHWCPIKPGGSNCLIPISTTIREEEEEREKQQQQQHEGESLDFESICQQLKLGSDEKKRKRAQRYIDKSVEEKLIE